MESETGKKKTDTKDEASVLGETYEKGKPDSNELGRWRQKLSSREEKLRYLKAAERYWYSDDWYGSEKRKNPA